MERCFPLAWQQTEEQQNESTWTPSLYSRVRSIFTRFYCLILLFIKYSAHGCLVLCRAWSKPSTVHNTSTKQWVNSLRRLDNKMCSASQNCAQVLSHHFFIFRLPGTIWGHLFLPVSVQLIIFRFSFYLLSPWTLTNESFKYKKTHLL